MKKVILIIIVCCLFGCTNESGTRNLLENSGYTDIEITGYSMFGCSEDDTYQTGFKARNISSGKTVKGVVCEGLLFKGSTIRFK